MKHKIIFFFMIVLIVFVMPLTLFAEDFDPDRVGSISVTLIDQDGNIPITDAELSLYYVATVKLNSKNNLSYTFTNAFENCGFALDDTTLSVKLDSFVEMNPIDKEVTVTDAYGNAAFTDLLPGLYFVKQTSAVEGYAPCTSFLVTIPNCYDDIYVYDINASPKTEVAKLTDITIKKIWNTDASTKMADSVTVQLLRDGIVVKTATLNEQNNWQVVYSGMPESDLYSISEKNVPKGFTATYSQKGYVFTVTNSASLIQTGQLIWPIPVLTIAGLFFIAVGVIILKKTRNKDA